MLMNVLMFAFLAFMMIRMMSMSKRNKMNKELIDVVNAVFDEQVFFEKADLMIDTVNDPEFESKCRIIKLWGSVYYKQYDKFAELLEPIEIEPLFIKKKNGAETVDLNEDSFFYLCMAIPNLLYKPGKNDLRASLKEKLEPYRDRLNSQLFFQIGEACDRYYNNVDDRGEDFFKQVLDGEYGDFSYSKQMIGLYKMVCNAMLAAILKEQNRSEEYAECEPLLYRFGGMGVGKRWMESIGLEVKEEKPEADEEPETEEFEIDAPKDEVEEVQEVIEEAEKKAAEEDQ